jgi:hypothetical protein
MQSWRDRRRKRLERVEAEAEANVLIFAFGANAYSEARRREHGASSDSMARKWNQVALVVARKTGQMQYSLAFRPIAHHLGGSRPAGFKRAHSDTPSGSRCMASLRDWILPD